MTTITLDILARIDSASSVQFWRPLAWGETSSSTQQFGTGRDWVVIPGNALDTILGARRTPTTLVVRMTGFVPTGSTGGSMNQVVTLGSSPPPQWRLWQQDPKPPSPTYISPNIDASSPPIELRAELTVDTDTHVLDLDLAIQLYADGDPPPSPPIIIADVPDDPPQPQE